MSRLQRPHLAMFSLLVAVACTPLPSKRSSGESGVLDTGSAPSGATGGDEAARLVAELEPVAPVCGSADVRLTLSTASVDGVRLIDADIGSIGEGWTLTVPDELQPPDDGLEITADSPATLRLQTTGGRSMLVLLMSDRSELHVELVSATDQPPTIELRSPADGVLPDEDQVELVLEVQDDRSPTDELWVDWGVSGIGVLAEGGYDADDGLFHLVLARDVLPPGPLELRARASDGCDPEGEGEPDTEVWFELCQDGRVEGEALDPADFALWWGASTDGTSLSLTSNARNDAGAAFHEDPVEQDELHLGFEFYVGLSDSASYGSGLALVLLDGGQEGWLATPPSDDQIDCGLGYARTDCSDPEVTQGLGPLVIELDDRYNAGIDPTEFDHVELVWWGDPVGHSLSWANVTDLEDGAWHEAELDLRPADEDQIALRFWVDGRQELDWTFAAADLDEEALVGFTAGTAPSTAHTEDGESQSHAVREVRHLSFACDDFTR